MAEPAICLTGVWHGLYYYPIAMQPVYFVATLISFHHHFTGSTHEAAAGRSAVARRRFANLEGSIEGTFVQFRKQYDPASGWSHAVHYDGRMSADLSEIEGTWALPEGFSGRFLMVRGQAASEQIVRQAFGKV